MTIDHTFLSTIPADQRADRIAALPEWRKKQIISRAFPGVAVNGADIESALELAGANFEAKEAEVRYSLGGFHKTAPNHKVIVHPGTGAALGVVGKGYGIVQHQEAFAGLGAVVRENLATLESVSVEDGGARVTATALLGFTKIEQGDRQDSLAQFLRATNTHDGSGSYNVGLYTLRLICLNGLTNVTKHNSWSIRHTRNAAKYVADLESTIFNLVNQAKTEADEYQALAQAKLGLEEFIQLATGVLTDIRGEADTERKQTRRENDVVELTTLFEQGRGNVGETAYDAYNAFTDWLSVRRNQYDDAAKFARSFRNAENGNANRVRANVRERLLRRVA